MKKKIILIITILVLAGAAAAVIGLGKREPQLPDHPDFPDNPVKPTSSVVLAPVIDAEVPEGAVSAQVISYEEKLLTVIYRNRTEVSVMMGEDYALRKKNFGLYEDLIPETDPAWDAVGHMLGPGEDLEIVYAVGAYGDLPAGDYQICNQAGFWANFTLLEQWTE